MPKVELDDLQMAHVGDLLTAVLPGYGFVLVVGECDVVDAPCRYIASVQPESAQRMMIATAEQLAAGNGRHVQQEAGHA